MRDLPAKDSSFDSVREFGMVCATKRSATAALGRIASALRQGEGPVLATDPDGCGDGRPWFTIGGTPVKWNLA